MNILTVSFIQDVIITVFRGVINKFVDKCYSLKTLEGNAKWAQDIDTGLFCNLHIKLCAILTSGSAINEF